MATRKKSRAPQKTEEVPAAEIVAGEATVPEKIAVKKTAAARASSKKPRASKPVAKKAQVPKIDAETVPTKKAGGFFARAVRSTFFSAGRLVSKTKGLKNITKVVKWKNISTGAKTVVDSTKQGVEKIGGGLKNAVSVEKISMGTKKVWSTTREGVLKVGETIKSAVPAEKISAETKKAWSSAKESALRVGETLKGAVPAEKISAGTKKVWTSTTRGVSKISRDTADGLTQIGKSFKAGYQSFEEKETSGSVEPVIPSEPEKVAVPQPVMEPAVILEENSFTELKPEEHGEVSVQVMDPALEKEVDQIVSEIAEI